MACAGMHASFQAYKQELEQQSVKRELISSLVQQIDAVQRDIATTLQQAHKLVVDRAAIVKVLTEVDKELAKLAPTWEQLSAILDDSPRDEFVTMWQGCVSRLVFHAAFAHWLDTRNLISMESANQIIGLSSVQEKLGLRLIDYLLGLCSLPGELSRLCTNMVTQDEYDLPQQVCTFVNELYGAFQMLNLRNDILRRKYDSIKYDVQRIEGVVYDISLRGLAKQTSKMAIDGRSSFRDIEDTLGIVSRENQRTRSEQI